MTKGVFYAVIGAIAIAVAGATYAYVQRPERAVSNALQKLGEADTQGFEAQIMLDNPQATQQILQNAGSLTLALNGSFDRRGEERDSIVSDININAQTEGVTVALNGQLRLIGDQAYLLVQQSPSAIPLLAALKDKWVELPRGEVKEASTPEEGSPLLARVEKAGREKVGDVSTVKYEAVATQTGIVRFMDNIAQLLGTRLSDQQITTIQNSLANTQELPVALWVTPGSHELVQLETRLGDSGTRYLIKFHDRNEPVEHTVPDGAKPIQEVLPQGQ